MSTWQALLSKLAEDAEAARDAAREAEALSPEPGDPDPRPRRFLVWFATGPDATSCEIFFDTAADVAHARRLITVTWRLEQERHPRKGWKPYPVIFFDGKAALFDPRERDYYNLPEEGAYLPGDFSCECPIAEDWV